MSTEQTEEAGAQDGTEPRPEDRSRRSRRRKKKCRGVRASARAKVEHFTPAERAARGKAARAEVPRTFARRVGAAAAPARPRRAARGAGADPRARARADPVRPDARLAVHVLPRRRLPDGVRPGRRPAHRPAHAALRRRPPVQLRRLRGARPPSRLRTQRLRRDAPRAVRVGRQAPRRELRRRRPRPRLRREDAREDQHHGRAVATARRSASSGTMRNLDVWYARVDLDDLVREFTPARPPSSASGWRRTSRRRGRRTA